MSFYYQTFYTNILQLLELRGISKRDLATASGVSLSFISEITTGKANPSLETMAAIASSLGVPLGYLLEHTDLDAASRAELAGDAPPSTLSPGYEYVCVILPTVRAYQARIWGTEAMHAMRSEPRH